MDMTEKEEVRTERKEIVSAIETLINEARVVNFSDAVFAFAATLLVLKIDLGGIVPTQIQSSFWTILVNMWPVYLANIVSFLVISYYWLSHHAVFGLMKRLDPMIVWLNIVFLISIAFLPFPVDLFGDYSTVPEVVLFYTGSLAVVGYFLAVMWWYASSHHRLIDKDLSERHVRFYTIQNLIAPVVFTLSMPLVYIDPWVTQVTWIFVVIGIAILNKFYKYKKMTELEKIVV
ncbi:MAG: DUF1211 domain-containing protein [Candidatus Levybacteria bacterium]|nr:DUF1211 domain-containing protein [Candidatus Levybacteria bacterium]